MKTPKTKIRSGLLLVGIACSLVKTFGADTPAGDSSWVSCQKPVWLTDLGVTVKESYDDNVLMSGVDQRFVPAGTTTLKDRASSVTTVSPTVGIDFARFLHAGDNLQLLSLTYAPDFVVYQAMPEESYDAHRFNLAVKGKADAFSYNLENATTYVDGSRQGPIYPGDLRNAWATIFAYQRREQVQDRDKLTFQYDWDRWFVRPGACLAYYGLMTDIKNPSLPSTPEGYQNYASRYDANGGLDLGYKFCPDLAGTLGYRYGHQYQEQYSFSDESSPSDYQRVLLGVEGKPFSWLKAQVQGGPDFRTYEANSATHITPVSDHHPVKYYGEAVLCATLTPKDALTFKYKQYQFVSICGDVPYFDSYYDLSYRRKLTDRLSLDLGARLLSADYTSGNAARDDRDYILSAGLHYSFNTNLAADLGYSADLGRNAQDNITNQETRDFNRQLVWLGIQFKL